MVGDNDSGQLKKNGGDSTLVTMAISGQWDLHRGSNSKDGSTS